MCSWAIEAGSLGQAERSGAGRGFLGHAEVLTGLETEFFLGDFGVDLLV